MTGKLLKLVKAIAIKIANFLHCGVDKVYHYGLLIFIMILNIGLYLLLPMIWFLAVVGVQISVTKEYGDSKNPANIFSWWDIFADCLGIATVIIGYFLYPLIF